MKNDVNNLKNLRKSNKSTMLWHLYNQGAMSRLQLASMCGLTTAAITMLVKAMLEEGSVVEIGSVQRNNSGRREILIDINYDNFVALSVNIEGDNIHLSICKLNDVILENIYTTSTLGENPFENLKAYIDKTICGYEDKIMGIGVGIVGVVDENLGILTNSYGLFSKNFPLKQELEKIYEYEIIVRNNIKTQAFSFVNDDNTNFMYIKHSPGLGCAIVIDGKIVNGVNNMAGEIGHTIIDAKSKLCESEKCGNLESFIAEKNIEKHYFELSKKEMSIQQIYDSYLDDSVATLIIDDCIERLCIAIINSVTIIDPYKIMVMGGIFEKQKIFDVILKKLNEFDLKTEVELIDKSLKIKAIAGARLILKKALFEV